MLVALDKPTAVRMYNYITEYWQEYLAELRTRIETASDEQEELQLKQKYEKVAETEVCVVVSAEQNEVDKFKKLGLDIAIHRKKFVERDLEKEFKDADNPFRLAIVCAMWITGFDAPCVSTVYLDKPIKGHTLMQTIARANRVYDDEKENGLIVDYGNVYKQLEEAYSVYGEGDKGNTGDIDSPTQTMDELADELAEAITEVSAYLTELGFNLENLLEASALERLGLITDAINSVCTNGNSRAKFEVMARNTFKKYKALFPEDQAKQFTSRYNAIEAIYNGLNQKVKEADITEVMKRLQELVGDSITINPNAKHDDVYIDLSSLDFDKLKRVFEKRTANKIMYDLQQAVDAQLKRMLDKNPLRLEFYDKYQKIIEEYNNGKDADAIRKAFEDLVKFINEMNEEEHRSAKEGLDEETLAIYDLLRKDSLTKDEEAKVKEVAIEMLAKLKAKPLKVERYRESTQITAQVRTMIHDNLVWLPQESYLDEEVDTKAIDVYQHIYSNYYGGGASTYNTYAA
jgi:type I restriction enzyme R subunit